MVYHFSDAKVYRPNHGLIFKVWKSVFYFGRSDYASLLTINRRRKTPGRRGRGPQVFGGGNDSPEQWTMDNLPIKIDDMGVFECEVSIKK